MKKHFLSLLFIPPFFLSAQNIYDFDHSLKYGQHLFSAEKFEPASKEFERLLYFYPENDTLIYFLSRSYLRSKQYEKSLVLVESKSIINNHSASILYLDLLLLSKRYNEAEKKIATEDKFSEEEKKIFNSRLILYSGNFKLLKKNGDAANNLSSRENSVFNEARQFHKKIPALALGFSLVPGLGKVYTKNYSDAVMSFFTIGLCSFLAYRGFDKKGTESAPGWFYGGLGIGLYFGNFYGSFKAAKSHNEKFKEHIANEMDEIIISELLTCPQNKITVFQR